MSNMKTFPRTITITIDRCNHCHYFHLGEVGSSTREHCKFHIRDVKYDAQKHYFPIPDWCEVEKVKGDGQHIPRNFEG